MLIVVNNKAFEVSHDEGEAVLAMIAPKSKGIYALQRDDIVMLVNEPYSAQRVLEHEADGWKVRYRR